MNVDFSRGSAVYLVTGLALRDYGSLSNAFLNGPFVPATATFVVRWFGIKGTGRLTDAANTFTADFVNTDANIVWTAQSRFANFASTRVTKVNFAELARERNGVFFSQH